MSARRGAAAVASIAISALAVALLVRSTDIAQASVVLSRLALALLALPLLSVLAQFLVRAARWQGIAAAISHRNPRFASVMASLAVGYLGNTVLPARLGEAIRAVDLSRRGSIPLTEATASVVLERSVDMLGLGTLAAVAAVLVASESALALVLLPFSLVCVAALRYWGGRMASRKILPTSPILRVAAQFVAHFSAATLPVLVRAYVLSVLAWVGDTVLILLCAASLGVRIDLPTAVVLGVAADLSTLIPSAGGYVGTYELGIVTAGVSLGLSSGDLLAIAVVAHLVAVLPLGALGIGEILRRGWAARGVRAPSAELLR